MKFRSTLSLVAAGAGAGIAVWNMRRQMRRMDFQGASVVITGGSRGLGLEMARQFGMEGARLSLLARSADELDRAAMELKKSGTNVETYVCDITDPDQIKQTVAEIIQRRGSIDVLINNAGVIQVAPFENLDIDDYRSAMDVYAWGPLHLIRAVVPHMKRRRMGRIVNISSIGGLVAVPHLLAYCMGKFALTALSSGLRAELAKDGIVVTTVAPGLMRTGSHVNALFKGQHRKEYAWFAISGGNPLLSTTARRAARKIIDACRFGNARLIITLPASLLHIANALFPGVTAFGTTLAARMLPAPVEKRGNLVLAGWQSSSPAAPSILTRLADRMVRVNNEKQVKV